MHVITEKNVYVLGQIFTVCLWSCGSVVNTINKDAVDAILNRTTKIPLQGCKEEIFSKKEFCKGLYETAERMEKYM